MSEVKYTELKHKYERIAFLKRKLATDARWATQAVARIFEYQTADEQATDTTRIWNGVGFTGADAEILSSFAKQINENRFAGSPKQMSILFKKMPKYAKQLERIASTKEAA